MENRIIENHLSDISIHLNDICEELTKIRQNME